MSYLVLARKWRPQTFTEIVGQEHVTRTLTNAIGAGRIHHAFLFSGARGVGKTTAARILAKALCCDQGPTPTPCNACDLCREITAGNAVDVQEIDGASNNSVDEIRQLRENVKYQPARARRKIFIIDEVHMLSGSAFNALLKTLEEPPPHVTFIFATTEPHKIPITILSRCQRYDFKLVPTATLDAHLARITHAEQLAISPGARAAIAREAQGSVRDALSLLDQMVAYAGAAPIDEALVAGVLGIADRSILFDLSRAVLDRDARQALTILAQVFERGADLGQFARAFAGHLRDLHVTKACGGDPSGLVEAASADLEELVARATRAPQGLLGQLFERMSRAVDEVARAPLPRHALEAALLDLCHAEPVLPRGDLLARLAGLEARLGGAAPPRGAGP
ncbi:MAG TPA: DNA polymerase III subunit gamma/tau, partial [Polyangia bacterium]